MVSKLRRRFRPRRAATVEELRERLSSFHDLVDKNDRVLEMIADAGEKLGGEYLFDGKYLEDLARNLRDAVHGVVDDLNTISGNRFPQLFDTLATIDSGVRAAIECRLSVPEGPYVLPLHDVSMEHVEAVGEKMARLGEMRSRLECRVPEGFVVTTWACQQFLDQAGITERVEALRARGGEPGGDISEQALELRDSILQASLPRELRRAIQRAVARFKGKRPHRLFAVRSSAVGEDTDPGLAGQYTTILGCEPDDVCDAYREVVASLFAPSVLRHHHQRGEVAGCGLMAVGCLCMVPARASGVAYTLNPMDTRKSVQLITSAWGLGKIVVDGEAPVDRFEVSRQSDYPIASRQVATKSWKYTAVPGRGLAKEPVPEAEAQVASLTEAQLGELARLGCRLERFMKSAQDIEWALDAQGRLFLLQARPLAISASSESLDRDLSEVVAGYRVLLRGKGEVACRGIGSGRIHVARDGAEAPVDVPAGAVLLARAATPLLGGILPGAAAVITDIGNATGHFATVAREFRVPAIVGTGMATEALREGMEVTVDAEENVVYEGRIDELLRYQLLKRSSFEDAAEFRALRRMLRRIAPLRLRDPESPDFTTEHCLTYHDVIRFAHEKALAELVELGWVKPSRGGRYIRRLELPIPLDLTLIDLGGGFRPEARLPTLRLEDLMSRPLVPLLRELTSQGAWETAPADMDLDGFMSSATRSMALTGPLAARLEQNLAIVSGEYLHLSLRLGYHFNIVDAYLGEAPGDNYIYFRFAGGVTELTRRSRRASLLRRILEAHGFITEGRGDLVIGRLKGLAPEQMIERLQMVGRLIGFTRQLDIHLRSDRLVDEYVARFMEGSVTP